MVLLGEGTYKGPLQGDHKHIDMAFLFVGVFKVENLLVNINFQMDRLTARFQTVANKSSIYKVDAIIVVGTQQLPAPVSHFFIRERCYTAALMSLMIASPLIRHTWKQCHNLKRHRSGF